jgi:GNAT superfamily N-acetyltransferase
METALQIRLYEPADLKGAVGLWRSAWQAEHPGEVHPYPIERWEYVWQRRIVRECEVWVACQGGELAGYVAVTLGQPYVHHMIVGEGHRRRGVGSELIERAKWVHARELHCLTREGNSAMRELLVKSGFVEQGAGDVLGGRGELHYWWMRSCGGGAAEGGELLPEG